MNWFLLFLFLHISGAIIAFGPTIAFPFIAAQNEANPAGAKYGAMIIDTVGKRVVVPVALTMPVTGIAMILVVKINLFATPYLLVALVLWAAIVSTGIWVQLPTAARLMELLSAGPAPGTTALAPPPEVAKLIARGRLFGILQLATVFVIVLLMVFKPGGLH